MFIKKGGREEIKHLGEVGFDSFIYSCMKGGYYA